MQFGIRTRLLAWLVVVALPVAAASLFAVRSIDNRLSSQIEADLASGLALEAARIEQAVDDYDADASSLAANRYLRSFLSDIKTDELGLLPRSATIGGVDGFRPIDADDEFPLNEVASYLLNYATTAGTEVLDLQIQDTEGRVYGATPGFSWTPYDPAGVADAIRTGQVQFGNAFMPAVNDARLGAVAPITNNSGRTIGALVAEFRLGPIVDLVSLHESFGETRESYVVQPDAAGNAELITPLRFNRNAAFSLVVDSGADLPADQSLDSFESSLVRADDYRAVDTVAVIQTLDRTRWGLVVKTDAKEAFAPVSLAKQIVTVGSVVTLTLLLGGWALLLHPISRRLRRAALSAKQVAAGNLESQIEDRTNDEIGEIARSLDQLATDLSLDIAIRADVESRLRHQANHDELTNLFNRQHANETIRALFSDEHRYEKSSVLFIDLDGFKNVNDTYGHPVGDEVLVAVANRLLATTDSGAIVARWGGDEFVIILPETDEAGAAAVSDRVQALFDDPITTSAGHHQVGCSIGVSTWEAGRTVDSCLHEADQDMFAQKQTRSGKRAVAPATVRAVEHALEEDRLEVHYQPLVTMTNSGPTLIGAEALVRLREVEGEALLPAEFLQEVEPSQLGLALDRRVMDIGLADLAGWVEGGIVDEGFKLALNAGSGSLRDLDYADSLLERVADHDLAPSAVVVEISERVQNFAPGQIDRLRDAGVVLAIDDVGLQYSNIDRLLDIRANIAKIDRRWLGPSDAPMGADTLEILRGVISLCRTLDMKIVAEGVETFDQLNRLRDLGVKRFQGFYFGQAVPAPEFAKTWGQKRPLAI